MPTGIVQTGIGFHPHERRLPAWYLAMWLM